MGGASSVLQYSQLVLQSWSACEEGRALGEMPIKEIPITCRTYEEPFYNSILHTDVI